MSTATAISLDPDFLAICRELGIAPSDDEVQRRWSLAASLASAVKRDNLDALIRVAFELQDVNGTPSFDWVCAELSKGGRQMSARQDGREVQLTAAASLLALCLDSKSLSVTAGVSVITSTLWSTRETNLPFDLVYRAQCALQEQSEQIRTRRQISVEKVKPKVADAFTQAAAAFAPTPTDPNQAFVRSTEGARNGINAVLAVLSEALEGLGLSLAAKDEELDMLWWLTGGRLKADSTAFKDLNRPAQPLIVAADLADLTTLLPGPVSVLSILARAIDTPGKVISIRDCINGCDFSWIESRLRAKSSPVSQPLHFALERRLETRDDTNWVAGWEAQTKLTAGLTGRRTSIAESFYLETLLFRS